MTREEAKELLPIIQAFAEGKPIQDKIEGITNWVDTDEINLVYEGQKIKHRIKPEPKYRPFKSIEECLTEILRHSDIGYIRYKSDGKKEPFRAGPSDIEYVDYRYGHGCCSYGLAFEMFTFTDGTPFGIKEE